MNQTFADIIIRLTNLITWAIIPLLTSIGLLYFLYGLVLFMSNSGNETKRSDGRKYIMYGVAGLFVMTAVWGLVRIFTTTFFGYGDIGMPLINF